MLQPDQPIISKHEDLLNRTEFTKSLAQALLNYKLSDSFTIGLYGKWGSGKTSVLNMVCENLNELSQEISEDERPIVMKFNPWNFSDQNQLINQFFKELSCSLKKDIYRDKLKGIGESLELYSDMFSTAAVFPIVGKIGFVFALVMRLLGKSTKRYLQAYNANISNVKEGIVKALKKENIKIIIIIDDIDRLTNLEIRQIFQLVKTIADFPNTVYVLSFDRDIVINALNEVQNGDGQSYLEKIVQVPFQLPEINRENIYKIFFAKLDEVIINSVDEEFDKYYWHKIFYEGIAPLIGNVRDITRIINAFSLKFALVGNDTNFIDLLAITALQVFEPEVFEDIRSNKELFTGSTNYYEKADWDKTNNAFENAWVIACEENREAIKSILKTLFPKISVASSSYTTDYYDGHKSLRLSMIRNPKNFDTYFKLSIGINDISKEEVKRILFEYEEKEIDVQLQIANRNGQIPDFLDKSRAYLNNLKGTDRYLDRIPMLLNSLYGNWYTFDDSQSGGFFSIPFIWRLLFISEDLVLICDKEEERYSILKQIMTNKLIPFSLRISQLLSIERKHGRFTEKKESSDEEKLIKLDYVLELEGELGSELKEKSEDEEMDYSLLDQMFFWQIIDESGMNRFIERTKQSKNGYAHLAIRFISKGRVASDFVQDVFNIHVEEMGKYLNVEETYRNVCKLIISPDFSKFEIDEKKKLVAFIIHQETIEDNYDGIKEEDVDLYLGNLVTN